MNVIILHRQTWKEFIRNSKIYLMIYSFIQRSITLKNILKNKEFTDGQNVKTKSLRNIRSHIHPTERDKTNV